MCQAIRPPAVAALKTAREDLGSSLADIKPFTGIEKSNVSRLENDPLANPTIDTLYRYTEAVGKLSLFSCHRRTVVYSRI